MKLLNLSLFIVTSPSFSSASSTTSSSSAASSAARLGQIRAELELARNFYDDFEFCPVQCSSEVLEHRERIQQRLSPQSSPNTSPSMSYARTGSMTPPKSRRAIPIINPSNMAPVFVPNQPYMMKSSVSPILAQQQQQQQQYWNGNTNSRSHMGYYNDVLVQ